MPHIPLLKMKPELAEQDKNDQETTEDDDDDDDVLNGQCDTEVNVNNNTACEYNSDTFGGESLIMIKFLLWK